MGKIIIHYEKHNESFFGRYWGLILFPLLPFWLLGRDDGMAGYLDVDGTTFKLKYKKKMHPQVIELSDGVHQIIYRKKSKFAIAFNLWSRSSGGVLDNILDSVGAYDDYKLDGFELNFGANTIVKLRAEGGVLRKCKIEDIENALPISEEERYGTPPQAKKVNMGCLLALLAVIGLMGLGAFASANSGKMLGMIKGDTFSGGSESHVQTTTTEHIEQTTVQTTTQTQQQVNRKKMYVRAKGGLNVRTGPSVESKVLFLLPERAEVAVLNTENGWALVEYEGKQGFSSVDYLVEDPALLDVPREEEKKDEESTGEKTYTEQEIEDGRELAKAKAKTYFGRIPKGGRTDITVDNVVAFFEEAQGYHTGWVTDFGSQFGNLGEPVKFAPEIGPHLFYVDDVTAENIYDVYFSHFTNDLAESYLDGKMYILDGKTAVFSAGMGFPGMYISHSCTAEQVSEAQINVNVTVKAYADYPYTEFGDFIDTIEIVETTHTFPCVLEDGAWVFSEMKTIYS